MTNNFVNGKVSITNQQDRFTVSGQERAYAYLKTDVRTVKNDVNGKVKKIAYDTAREASFVMKNLLSQHTYTGNLIRSVKIREQGNKYRAGGRTSGGAGGGSYRAELTVGVGVDHARYFFQGTGRYAVSPLGQPIGNSIEIYRSRDYGHAVWGNFPGVNPISYANGSGKRFIGTFKGQKDNLEIIKETQRAADKYARNRVNKIK